MEKKKLSTAEILAMARKQAEGGTSVPPSAESAAAPETAPGPAAVPESPEPVAAEPTAGEPAPAPPVGQPVDKPKSTADILAAARAKGGGAAAPAKSAAGAAAPVKSAAGAAAPGAAPKGTADILAAARAGKATAAATGEAPAKKAKPAGAAGAAAPVAATGDRPSVEQMLKAVREGAPAEPPRPKLPGKPPLPAPAKIERRSFPAALLGVLLAPFVIGWTLLSAVGALASLAMARFMMPNVIVELPSRFKVGPPSDYPLGGVSEKYKASRGIWIVHTDSYNGENLIYALASVCTHLGCTPNWLEAEQKYKCPCHGSGFYKSGINFEGPAPRPLERVGISVSPDGTLEIDKSVKFQEELGQWADPKSFVELA